jgi:hypothetical protein
VARAIKSLDPELDKMVADLRRAGLLTIGRDAQGRESWTLTTIGSQLVRQMAMSSEDDAVAMLDALLEMCDADVTVGGT